MRSRIIDWNALLIAVVFGVIGAATWWSDPAHPEARMFAGAFVAMAVMSLVIATGARDEPA